MDSPSTRSSTDASTLSPLRFGRGNRSIVSILKRFVDPLSIQAALVGVFWLFGEPLHGPVVLLALGTFLLTYPGSLPFRSRQFRLLGNILTRWALSVGVGALVAGQRADVDAGVHGSIPPVLAALCKAGDWPLGKRAMRVPEWDAHRGEDRAGLV